jgi:hypothetical protein
MAGPTDTKEQGEASVSKVVGIYLKTRIHHYMNNMYLQWIGNPLGMTRLMMAAALRCYRTFRRRKARQTAVNCGTRHGCCEGKRLLLLGLVMTTAAPWFGYLMMVVSITSCIHHAHEIRHFYSHVEWYPKDTILLYVRKCDICYGHRKDSHYE